MSEWFIRKTKREREKDRDREARTNGWNVAISSPYHLNSKWVKCKSQRRIISSSLPLLLLLCEYFFSSVYNIQSYKNRNPKKKLSRLKWRETKIADNLIEIIVFRLSELMQRMQVQLDTSHDEKWNKIWEKCIRTEIPLWSQFCAV